MKQASLRNYFPARLDSSSWPLQSSATISALVEMHFKPHFWSKTQRGLTTSQPLLSEGGQSRYEQPSESGAQLFFPFLHEAR